MKTTKSGMNDSPTKKPADDGKVYYSYADVHRTISSLAPQIQQLHAPDVILAIGGGGFIPARILRTVLKIPILAVSLELYDDSTNSVRASGVKCLQWFDTATWPGNLVNNGKVLIVDEVDDTRTTLQFCVEQVQKSKPSSIAVAVVHNKQKPKRGTLPDDVQYFAGQTVPDHWNFYPWDAIDIVQHEEKARQCSTS